MGGNQIFSATISLKSSFVKHIGEALRETKVEVNTKKVNLAVEWKIQAKEWSSTRKSKSVESEANGLRYENYNIKNLVSI